MNSVGTTKPASSASRNASCSECLDELAQRSATGSGERKLVSLSAQRIVHGVQPRAHASALEHYLGLIQPPSLSSRISRQVGAKQLPHVSNTMQMLLNLSESRGVEERCRDSHLIRSSSRLPHSAVGPQRRAQSLCKGVTIPVVDEVGTNVHRLSPSTNSARSRLSIWNVVRHWTLRPAQTSGSLILLFEADRISCVTTV